MESLTRSSSKIVIDKYRDGLGAYKDTVPRALISFSKCHRRVVFPNSSFVHCKSILPIVPPIAATSDSQASKTSVDGKDQLSTAPVKFQLQKACGFGDHFLMVGDDPMFGCWDPQNAVPLEWSDGHMWTAELDIPIGKVIQFKFIMKQRTGGIIWQPGPDRVFKTWATNKTIMVVEDWENSELQNIIEDGVPGHDEELIPGLEGIQQIDGSSRTQTNEMLERIIAKDTAGTLENPLIAVEENITLSDGLAFPLAAEEGSYSRKESTISTMVADNIVSDHGRLKSADVLEDEELILADPVLVPGLAPMSNLSTDVPPLANIDKNSDLNGSMRSQDSKDQTATESCSNSKAESEEVLETHEKVELQLQEEQQLDLFPRQENLKGESSERHEPNSAFTQESLKAESEEVLETHEKVELQLQEKQQLDLFPRQENLKGESSERHEPNSAFTQESLKADSEEEQKADITLQRKELTKTEFSDDIAFDIPRLAEAESQEGTVMRDCYRVLKYVLHWGRKTLQNFLTSFGLC
ncbi:unnamed protein product [Rhodiola kirilowii]